MSRRTQTRYLSTRDAAGTLRMSTKEFALLLSVPENGLGQAITTTMIYKGEPLPEHINRHSGRTRQFYWNDCLDFAQRLLARTKNSHK